MNRLHHSQQDCNGGDKPLPQILPQEDRTGQTLLAGLFAYREGREGVENVCSVPGELQGSYNMDFKCWGESRASSAPAFPAGRLWPRMEEGLAHESHIGVPQKRTACWARGGALRPSSISHKGRPSLAPAPTASLVHCPPPDLDTAGDSQHFLLNPSKIKTK